MPRPGLFRFVWILGPRQDLLYYIGSALAGWLYLGIVLYAVHALADPLKDPLATLRLGGIEIPLSLHVLVVASWAYVLDAPHVWATLGRTLFDPDEWRTRGRQLLTSFAFFLLGPLCILLPYAVAALGFALPVERLAVGAVAFFVFFRLWAYYHVVRQHWGFFGLYRRKAGEGRDLLDYAFFNASMYGPLLLFMTAPHYALTPGYPDLGLQAPLLGDRSLASLLHPLLWSLYLGIFLLYVGRLLRTFYRGEPLNASKLLYMALVAPLHLAAFSHPVVAVFVVPLVTVGHNVQYLRIVYGYGRSKYTAVPGYRWARPLFRNAFVYLAAGLLFTFALYRGPWIEWLKSATGLRLDRTFLDALGMMAGIQDPAALGLGEQLFAAAILGFAMQHYYLDARIWRLSRDGEVRRHLRVE